MLSINISFILYLSITIEILEYLRNVYFATAVGYLKVIKQLSNLSNIKLSG